MATSDQLIESGRASDVFSVSTIPSDSPRPRVSQPRVATKRLALCVDANETTHDVLGKALTGCEVVFASAAYDALRHINSRAFDLYVLDYWLPDWSGLSLCRDIRKLDPNAPVFFCTAAAQLEHRRRAERAGATAYFVKPADATLIRQEASRVMQLRARRNEEAQEAAASALQQELAKRVATLPGGRVSPQLEPALKRSARNKARAAFLGSGGTVAFFERCWEGLWQYALQKHTH